MESLGKPGDQRGQTELDFNKPPLEREYRDYSKEEIARLGSEVVESRKNDVPLTPEQAMFAAADAKEWKGDGSYNPRE